MQNDDDFNDSDKQYGLNGMKMKILILSTFGKLAPNLHIYEHANWSVILA